MSEFPQPIEYDVLPKAVMDYSTLTVIGGVMADILAGARIRGVFGSNEGDLILVCDRFIDGAITDDDPEFDRWLFSCDPKLFRVHSIAEEVKNKSVHGHFSDVASHHLSGAKVEGVTVSRFERVLILDLSRREYTGEEITYRLIAELMGKHSNLILADSEGIIIASYKSIHPYQSRVREIRAGKEYKPPPKQDRVEPREFTDNEWRDFLQAATSDDSLGNHISRTFQGMSLTWARIICSRAGVASSKPVLELSVEEGERLRLAFVETLGEVLDGVPLTGESRRDLARRVAADFCERAEDLAIDKARRKIKKVIDRRRKKLRALEKGLEKDLDQAGKANEYKKKADLLLANIHKALPGINRLVVEDWENEETVELSLDPFSTPQLQVERWYKRYRRLKRRETIAGERKRVVRAEEEELAQLERSLAEAASYDEISAIQEQCVLRGLIPQPEPIHTGKGRADKKPGRKSRQAALAHVSTHRYRSNDGFLIIAGGNNLANDALRRASSSDDIWLHTRDIPGSHVYIITRGQEVPETTLKEAAMIAAWHSKARDGSKIPVDYTRAKYITPIPGAGPGRVNFRRERTIKVTPDVKRIEMMHLMAGGSIEKGS